MAYYNDQLNPAGKEEGHMSPEGPETVATEERSAPAKSTRTQARKSAPKAIVLPSTLTVKRLAELTQISPIDTIKQLMRNGMMVSLNQVIDYEVATLVTSAFGVRTRQGEDRPSWVSGRQRAPME